MKDKYVIINKKGMIKMNDEYKNLEEFLYYLRHKKEWSYEKLAEKFN